MVCRTRGRTRGLTFPPGAQLLHHGQVHDSAARRALRQQQSGSPLPLAFSTRRRAGPAEANLSHLRRGGCAGQLGQRRSAGMNNGAHLSIRHHIFIADRRGLGEPDNLSHLCGRQDRGHCGRGAVQITSLLRPRWKAPGCEYNPAHHRTAGLTLLPGKQPQSLCRWGTPQRPYKRAHLREDFLTLGSTAFTFPGTTPLTKEHKCSHRKHISTHLEVNNPHLSLCKSMTWWKKMASERVWFACLKALASFFVFSVFKSRNNLNIAPLLP